MGCADYSYYKNDFGGSLITDEAQFKRFSNSASAFIDAAVGGHVSSPTDKLSDKLKSAECELIEVFAMEGTAVSRSLSATANIKSETVKNHSRTYDSAAITSADITWIDNKKREILLTYLGDTDLLRARGYLCTRRIR